MICDYCHKEILPGDQKYFSKQVGLEGSYHWSCFIEACRKSKKSDELSDSSSLGDIDLSLLESVAPTT